MEDIHRTPYIIGMAAGGLIVAMGMQAENQDRLLKGLPIAFTNEAFERVMLDWGLNHNAILTILRG